MATEIQDDYIDCNAYQANIGNKSSTYPGFITFTESNGDHFFAWVNNNQIVMRSEAYPDADKMERGIKAILKNCDLPERYSVIQEEGKYLLLLWGGGNHLEHTGNREKHSEIGRSCPHNSREELNALLQFKGNDFANKVVPIGGSSSVSKPMAAAGAAVTAAAAASTLHATGTTAVKETTAAATSSVSNATSYASDTAKAAAGSSLAWLKWLLPLLLLLGAFLLWKSCNNKTAAVADVSAKDSLQTNVVVPALPKVNVDSTTGVVNYELGETGDLDLGGGVKLTGIAKDGFENTLVNFIKTGKIDTVNKKANWFNLHDVQFKTNKTEYATAKALQQIKNVGAILKANPTVALKLGGYTDISGNPVKNKDLSDRRAKQVMKDLIANGAAANQIKEAIGYGSEFAEAPVTDKEGMARDRKTAAKVASL